MLAACCLMPDACLLLAAWSLYTYQTHPRREAAFGRLHTGGLAFGRPPFVEPVVDGSGRCSIIKHQAASKHQASSSKHQASSRKHYQTGLQESGKKLRHPIRSDSQFLMRNFFSDEGSYPVYLCTYVTCDVYVCFLFLFFHPEHAGFYVFSRKNKTWGCAKIRLPIILMAMIHE